MASIEIAGTVKALKGERVRVRGELAKLDKAITVLERLFRASAQEVDFVQDYLRI